MDARAGDLPQLLRKVLALEVRKGFQDTAVSGGLSAFVARQIQTNAQADRLAALVPLMADYARLDPSERRRRVERVQAALALPAAPPPAAHPPDSASSAGSATASPGRGVTAPAAPKSPSRAPAKPATRPRRQARAVQLRSLRDPVTALPGVGAARAEQLAALGVTAVEDLIYLVPRRYKDYAAIQPIGSVLFQRECTVKGEVVAVEQERTRTGKVMVTAEVGDATGRIRAVWFNPYLARQLHVGMPIALSGRVEQQRGILCFRGPEWEPLDDDLLHTGRIVPIYPLTRNLYQKQVRALTRLALDAGLPLVEDPLPDAIRERHDLVALDRALDWAHYPDSTEAQATARRRLAFDEFLVLQIGLVRRKVEWQAQPGHAFAIDERMLAAFEDALPFRLTGAQSRALGEILADMASPRPMSRLLQGDVGSGKTVVAAAAALAARSDGYQTAVLAPTEILAEQHLRNLTRLYDALPPADRPRVALLTGSTPAAERAALAEALADGDVDVLVGTHALLEERVGFRRLGLAVIDEQHRFGVEQRARLREKGDNPDVLVMTATPIPRSLALVLHGDLDVSIVDEMPPGRQPIRTVAIGGEQRAEAYRFVRRQVEQGRQAFIIYPLVEESEAIDARAATQEYERLAGDVFPDRRLGLLHGRMRPSEKEAIMAAFRDHEIDILVSTSVVEVGIDVPNATVMLIEGAERFGLSQLHQFRGRVGRGEHRSHCILLADEVAETGQRRLDALVETQDGFRLAEIDLELRGPGEFFGTRQSGLPDLRFASFGDVPTLQEARDEAHRILEIDRELALPEHLALRARVDRFWQSATADVS
ncbi:MAG TPA: ATP-dependent DNA helicase RecG [Thermomicrobiaceae bacterium]|nr:ATP-dependent DNA helicase RecG [Thermomicrobiaceae bacterium]